MSEKLLRTEDVTSFAKAAEWTGVTNEDRSAWLSLRKTMLTASDIAAIMGEDEHRSALDVYADKLTPPQDEVLALNDPRFWGNVLEQPVLRAVAQYHGWKYLKGGALLRSREYPFLGATLDAEVDRNDGHGWVDLEGKTTRLPREWDEETGKLPTRVLIQVQVQLLVTGAPLAVVFALLQGNTPVTIVVEPSPEFHQVIIEEAAVFMGRIRERQAPLPDGTPAARRALNRMFPLENGSVVALPPEAATWTSEYQAITQQIAALKRRKEYYGQLLKHSMGTATYGVLPSEVGGKRCWRWQTQKRTEYEVEATEARTLVPLKLPPAGAPNKLPPAQDGFLKLLQHSTGDVPDTENNTNVTPIRFGQRRRSRR